MNVSQEPKGTRFSTIIMVVAISVSLLVGGLLGYAITYSTISGRIDDLQNQLSTLPYQNVTYFLDENVSLSQLYQQVKESVVVIRGQVVQYDFFHRPYYSQVQGSGFVHNFTGEAVVITNYHVVQNAVNITATFVDGNTYPTTVLGSDPYEDLAVLLADAPQSELKPVAIVSSSTLEVGDPVIAVGTPYGLAGSMTVGVVSALGRTISEETTGGYPIASIIQTSTPINPGNSGGPLLNYQGKVVGITTAIVSNSQGLGFAIPSNAILREIDSLITKGSYDQHPSLGVTGTDMSYEIAEAMGANVTYGWLIVSGSDQTGLRGGTSQVAIAGEIVTVGGDIIIAINETRITNIDDLSTYLEEYTLPNQTIDVTIVRNGQTLTLPIKLGTRPPPSV
jgi:2-alkenal reductase